MPDLYTFGEAMALFLASDTDSVLTARTYTRSTAGAEGNVAVGVSRLGLSAHFFTLMGNDQLGSAVLADFAAEGVDVSGVKRVDSFSSAMIRNPGTTAPVEASYLRKGAAASLMVPADLDQQVIAQSRWLHATGITCAISSSAASSVAAALEHARDLGTLKSFDLNIRRKLWSEEKARKVLEPLARDVDLLIGGEDEYCVVFGTSDSQEALRIAASRNNSLAIMTKGPEELRYALDGQVHVVRPPLVKSIDPVGSGDAFTSGVISGLLGGLTAADAIAQGTISGARVASQFGDWAGLPSGTGGITEQRFIDEILGKVN
ncbi:MAG: sugar kinase [Candidatus Nanopelagicaceae bacterium]